MSIPKLIERAIMMIDLETLSTKSNAYVLQIGSCVMDIATGEWLARPSFVTVYDRRQDAHVELSTAQWWVGQPAETRKHVLAGDFVGPGAAEIMLKKHFEIADKSWATFGMHPFGGVWAQGSQFDFPVLRNYLEGNHCECPWSFRLERDLRTLAAVADPGGRHRPTEENSRAHCAEADAEHQAQYLRNLHNKMMEV